MVIIFIYELKKRGGGARRLTQRAGNWLRGKSTEAAKLSRRREIAWKFRGVAFLRMESLRVTIK
jgi:hypothetical protein